MGTSSTRYERSRHEGYQIDPKASPIYFHSIERGPKSETGSARSQIDRSMSNMKVCRGAAETLQTQLQEEYFTRWSEKVDVQEYSGFTLSDLDTLLRRVSERFNINGQNIYNKLSDVRFCETVDVKIFEFTFGEQLSTGKIHFGMVAISKADDTLEAASALYTLEFEIARVLVTKKKKKRILGINAGADRKSWYETKSLGFVTQRTMVNFCRYKALEEFQRKDIVSSINNVAAIEDATH